MLVKKILVLAISSGLAATAWKALERRLQRQRVAHQRQADRAQIHRWEDEGGAITPASSPEPR
jgi:hypothetical protein